MISWFDARWACINPRGLPGRDSSLSRGGVNSLFHAFAVRTFLAKLTRQNFRVAKSQKTQVQLSVESRVFKTPRETKTCSKNQEFEMWGVKLHWRKSEARELSTSQYIYVQSQILNFCLGFARKTNRKLSCYQLRWTEVDSCFVSEQKSIKTRAPQ